MSNIITFVFPAFSKVSLFFTSIPFVAHFPSLTTIASGVAKPRLQGHATTKTDINAFIALPNSNPNIKYTINVTTAIIITAGTKYELALSASFAIGAFVFVASTTSLTISDIVESFPIFSALYSI